MMHAFARALGALVWAALALGPAALAQAPEEGPLEQVLAVSVGERATCAVRDDGAVYCWPERALSGVAPGGESQATILPRRVAGLAPVASVSVGVGHACAVTRTGEVWCWGENGSGQLGDGTSERRAGPVRVRGLGPAAAVCAGTSNTCAALADGSAWCWGQGDGGELGQGARVDSAVPVRVGGLDGVVAVAPGEAATCALRRDGTVWCWGREGGGLLGNGTTGMRSELAPRRVEGLRDVTALAMDGHACALTRDGTVWCWGAGTARRFGQPARATSPRPVRMRPVRGAVSVDVGEALTCVALRDGRVVCYGLNESGEGGPRAGRPIPDVRDAAVVETGYHHSCARTRGGALYCWGENTRGQLGLGTMSEWELATRVGGRREPARAGRGVLTGALDVALGPRHGCALRAEGALACWGDLDAAGLATQGTSSLVARDQPPVGPARQLVSATRHTCALGTDAVVRCWSTAGSNALGGVPPGRLREYPELGAAVHVDAEWNHTCAANARGEVWCWGWTGGLADRGVSVDLPLFRAPVRLDGVAGAVEVAVAVSGGCARRASGSVVCWTAGRSGPYERVAPWISAWPVESVRDAVELDAGGDRVCARGQSGALLCWDVRSHGRPHWEAPRRVEGLPEVRAIALAPTHACAVAEAGSLWCWGSNREGALGRGTAEARGFAPTPAPVLGLDGPVAGVRASEGLTCAILASGEIACFGRNGLGELGRGTASPPSGVPERVRYVPGR